MNFWISILYLSDLSKWIIKVWTLNGRVGKVGQPVTVTAWDQDPEHVLEIYVMGRANISTHALEEIALTVVVNNILWHNRNKNCNRSFCFYNSRIWCQGHFWNSRSDNRETWLNKMNIKHINVLVIWTPVTARRSQIWLHSELIGKEEVKLSSD